MQYAHVIKKNFKYYTTQSSVVEHQIMAGFALIRNGLYQIKSARISQERRHNLHEKPFGYPKDIGYVKVV